MHLIRCDATASYQTTTMTFQTNLNLTTVVRHYDIYLENCAAPVQPQKQTIFIRLEASYDANISKHYSHTSLHVHHLYKKM